MANPRTTYPDEMYKILEHAMREGTYTLPFADYKDAERYRRRFYAMRTALMTRGTNAAFTALLPALSFRLNGSDLVIKCSNPNSSKILGV